MVFACKYHIFGPRTLKKVGPEIGIKELCPEQRTEVTVFEIRPIGFVVEIFSPRTWWQDRRVKLPLYEETGVKECWLIDPAAYTVEIFV